MVHDRRNEDRPDDMSEAGSASSPGARRGPPLFGAVWRYAPIPPVFHSFLRRGLFEACLVCGRFLLKKGTHYVIEKAIRGEEVIFEYAVCAECYENMCDELSSESTNRVQEYYRQQRAKPIGLWGRRTDFAKWDPGAVDRWIDHCVVSRVPREECSEYQLIAECDGKDLVVSQAPFMISGHVMDAVVELLSPQTKGWMNDFIDEYLGIPPELRYVPKDRPLVIV
jgi:hypothetical protein